MRKAKKAKRKIKELPLKMRFNPGTLKFEPVLPTVPVKNIKNIPRKWTKKKFSKLGK